MQKAFISVYFPKRKTYNKINIMSSECNEFEGILTEAGLAAKFKMSNNQHNILSYGHFISIWHNGHNQDISKHKQTHLCTKWVMNLGKTRNETA